MDPDADPHPACHFDADPDPACHFDADPDPACHFDADPDPACHFDADPDPTFQLMRIRIHNTASLVNIHGSNLNI
jgi:hypothetical protein